MRESLQAFTALFVAVDILGLLPIYLSLTGNLPADKRRRLPALATLTALAIGLGFMLVGRALLRIMGVSVEDFQVAGGVLLLILSIHDLLHPGNLLRRPGPTVGAVPLGTPLIVGPAVLTTIVALEQSYGSAVTLGAFAVNMGLVFLALRNVSLLGRLLGEAGSQAVAKVASLFLAAFGVSLIRRGLPGFVGRS
ncbi:MAG TPA: MarC family protein [Candidatus Methylomirabilis sp.]|nr:MarC family protein [Candidatus Methylomirabilis sp.]HSB81465.1 MarC family protein [Candidatus Methylomirabilis sp.]